MARYEGLDGLVEQAAGARHVLLGEASHGTSEYYTWRAEITRRLIEEHGFSFVAVEGDWPSCAELDAFVRAPPGSGRSVQDALRAFSRWPTWMWANHEVADLLVWMRERNWDSPPGRQARFYGLDVYSLWESLDLVLRHVEEHAPDAMGVAQRALSCFEPYGRDEQAYAAATVGFVPRSCEEDVVRLLAQLRREPRLPFDALQNARVAQSAEAYYRAMVRGDAESWNVRDRHMHDTLERLTERHGADARGVVWAHNTHVGDARATDMAEAGMVNLGQLVREAHRAEDVFVVGFGSYAGSVIAGSYWGAPMTSMHVPEAREGSWEERLHEEGGDRVLLAAELRALAGEEPLAHRAIGVVYDPYRERWGNYVPSVLPERYDAFVFIDRTRALRPLHVPMDPSEMPETYPLGE